MISSINEDGNPIHKHLEAASQSDRPPLESICGVCGVIFFQQSPQCVSALEHQTLYYVFFFFPSPKFENNFCIKAKKQASYLDSCWEKFFNFYAEYVEQ